MEAVTGGSEGGAGELSAGERVKAISEGGGGTQMLTPTIACDSSTLIADRSRSPVRQRSTNLTSPLRNGGREDVLERLRESAVQA